jgi:hypothetical protein
MSPKILLSKPEWIQVTEISDLTTCNQAGREQQLTLENKEKTKQN